MRGAWVGVISNTICTCTFLVPVPGSLMNLARISPIEFLPQMASKSSTVHESWSLKVQPDHVLCNSHTQAQGKMSNQTTLYELYVLGLCSSAIIFKTEPLRTKPFNWEASEASSWLSLLSYTYDVQIYEQIQEEITKLTVTNVTRMDVFWMADKN